MQTIKQLMDLKGRRALVTGGAGYIGRTFCEGLLELGASVVMVDRNKSAMSSALKSLRTYKNRLFPMSCDLLSEKNTRQVAQQAIKKMKGLDILIHCAAYVGDTRIPGWAEPFERQSVSAWDEAMRVNLTSAFVLAQETRHALALSRHGSIIFISSIYGVMAPDFRIYEGTSMEHPAAYGSSKAGLLQLMRFLSTQFAPHIRVNAISPGGVWRNQPEPFHTQYKNRTPLRRMATEEDLKGAAIFLASDLSSYVTGHNLMVDGGWSIW